MNQDQVKNLLLNLDDLVSKGYIYESKKGCLSLFNYSDQTTYEKYWNEFTRMARGLIIDRENLKVVAWCMPKFFNYLENPSDVIPNCEFEIQEKIDGSCIFLWYHNNKWNCSTRGSFNSDQAVWSQKYFDNLLEKFNLNLDKETTYIFECVYPQNKIVVDYNGYEGCYLITAYKNGVEVPKSELIDCFKDIFLYDLIRLPSIISNRTIDDLVEICKYLSKNEEGFVVRWSNGFRLKIKGAEYLRVHKLISRITPLGIWEILQKGDDIESVKQQLPEEFYKDFDNLVNQLQSKFNSILRENSLWFIADEKNYLERKNFAREVALRQNKETIIPAVQFCFYDGKNNAAHDIIWKMIHPKGNLL